MSRTTKKDGSECGYSHKCPKCGGRLGSNGTRLSKRFGLVTRNRKCIKCGHKVQTAEVDFDDFKRQEMLIKALERAISQYLEKPDIGQKS